MIRPVFNSTISQGKLGGSKLWSRKGEDRRGCVIPFGIIPAVDEVKGDAP